MQVAYDPNTNCLLSGMILKVASWYPTRRGTRRSAGRRVAHNGLVLEPDVRRKAVTVYDGRVHARQTHIYILYKYVCINTCIFSRIFEEKGGAAAS